MRVITNIPGKPGGFWGENTILLSAPQPGPRLSRFLGKKWLARLAELISALRLFMHRRKCDAIVTGGGLDGRVLGCLQSLVPYGRRRHVMVDCNWYRPRNRIAHLIRSWELQLAARSVSYLVVWATHETRDYSEAFDLPQEKLVFVPFHTTLDNYQFAIRDDGYLFAGGNFDRDYRMLVDAVRGMSLPVWIATTRPELLNGVDVPTHVRVEGTSNSGFRQAMAAARLVVVPMEGGLLHSGGQQTCLNAMVLGKPTIAVGRPWASDFITDGQDGLIVDYGDVDGLRRAIEWVLDHPTEAAEIARRGKLRAEQFPTRRCMETLYRLALSDKMDDGFPNQTSANHQQVQYSVAANNSTCGRSEPNRSVPVRIG